jgi:catechol 2,3-dioxygenase-like lactoylglutathione lyase family enzyme
MGLRTSRRLQLCCAFLGFALALSSRVEEVSAETEPPLLAAVTGVEVVVSDLNRSQAFFEQLGFVAQATEDLSGAEAEARTGVSGAHVRRLSLSLGSEQLMLLQYLAPVGGRPMPPDTRGNDLWFQHVAIVVSDMDRAYAWLRSHRVVHVSSAPQTLPNWNRAAAGIQAFYFADPDGHMLELIHFPKGKGDPRWQKPGKCLRTPLETCNFLGIDHTAITVSDTDRSLSFYRDRLGLRVAGESENYGAEQEHLNGVFGAHLRITALRSASGPGIELLEYLSPRGGRGLPHDARPNDQWHWQVDVKSSRLEAAKRAATELGSGVVHASRQSALLRDRDGHALWASE